MNFYAVDILYVILVLIFVWKIRIMRPITAINEDYLSLDNCNAMRGLFALAPLIGHTADFVAHNAYTDWWTYYGHAVVGGFFFFTGFGLMKSHIHKPDYSKGYLTKRLPKIVIPYIVVTIGYQGAYFIFKGFLYPPLRIITKIFEGDPIVAYSWYVVHIIMFYIWFYILMKICKKHYLLMVLGGLLYYIGTTELFISRGFGTHWYQTSIALVLGMVAALHEKQVLSFMKRYYLIVAPLILAVTIFLAVGPLDNFYRAVSGKYDTKAVVVVFFVLLCILLGMMKAKVGNPILNFCGKLSYEIYLLHGLLIMILRCDLVYIENDTVFTLAVVFGTIIMAFIMHWVMDIFFGIIYNGIATKGKRV